MQGVTHAILGAGAGIGLAIFTHQPATNALAFTALGTVGGLLPDIDTPHSIISQHARPARLLTFWIKHRGLTHSALVLALLALACFALLPANGQPFVLALVIGYGTHLLADMATIEGVPLFYPVKRKIHILPPGVRLTTGGIIEQFFRLLMSAALLYGVLVMLGLPITDLSILVKKLR